MKRVGIFQVGILLEFPKGDLPRRGGGSLMGGIFRVRAFQGGVSLEPWNICKKVVNTLFLFLEVLPSR